MNQSTFLFPFCFNQRKLFGTSPTSFLKFEQPKFTDLKLQWDLYSIMLIMLILPWFASHWKVAVIRCIERLVVGISFNHLIMSAFSQALTIIATAPHPSVAGDPTWFQTVNQAFAAWIAAFSGRWKHIMMVFMTLAWSCMWAAHLGSWLDARSICRDFSGLWKADHVLGCWVSKLRKSEVSVSQIPSYLSVELVSCCFLFVALLKDPFQHSVYSLYSNPFKVFATSKGPWSKFIELWKQTAFAAGRVLSPSLYVYTYTYSILYLDPKYLRH